MPSAILAFGLLAAGVALAAASPVTKPVNHLATELNAKAAALPVGAYSSAFASAGGRRSVPTMLHALHPPLVQQKWCDPMSFPRNA